VWGRVFGGQDKGLVLKHQLFPGEGIRTRTTLSWSRTGLYYYPRRDTGGAPVSTEVKAEIPFRKNCYEGGIGGLISGRKLQKISHDRLFFKDKEVTREVAN